MDELDVPLLELVALAEAWDTEASCLEQAAVALAELSTHGFGAAVRGSVASCTDGWAAGLRTGAHTSTAYAEAVRSCARSAWRVDDAVRGWFRDLVLGSGDAP